MTVILEKIGDFTHLVESYWLIFEVCLKCDWKLGIPINETVTVTKWVFILFVMVKVESCTSATLKGNAVGYSKNN